ncbi:MAG: hypothetical protein ABIJ59_18405 [Pseudomonadota bacterium]
MYFQPISATPPELENNPAKPEKILLGKIWNLAQTVKAMGYAQLGYSPTTEFAERIAAFLKTLTGEQPKIEYPELPASFSKTNHHN